MKKGYKEIIILLILIAVGITVYNILINNGIIRNYHIENFVIDVTMESTGDITVKEDTTYKFNGGYNGITITIPTNVSKEYYEKLTKDSMNDSKLLKDSLYISSGIENVKIYVVENGTNRYFKEVSSASNGSRSVYTVAEEQGFTTYTIYEPSISENKQIVIEYTLKDVMVSHNDCTELFWNFIGGKVECEIKNLDINIYGDSILQAYTHGNSSGRITNTSSTAKVRYENVKPGEFVSTRILLSPSYNKTNKQTNITAMPLIKDLEESYKDKKQTIVNLRTFAVIMTGIIIAYWLFLLVRYEKEIEPVELVINDGDILNKYNPMIAACIAQNRGMHPRDILAVLIDLVNVGALKMTHIRGEIIGAKEDMYKLTKNEEFFESSKDKLDEIQISIIDIFFESNKEIELTKRLKQMQKDEVVANSLKVLDEKVATKLDDIGANYESVPMGLRIYNNFMFVIICIYILIMLAYDKVLSYITLSTNASGVVSELMSNIFNIIYILIFVLPIILFIIKWIVKLINYIRRGIAKLAFKLTTKKLTRRIITIAIIYILVFAIEIVLFDSIIIIATALFASMLLVILTDNLMTIHCTNIQKEYVMLKILQDKIENGSLLDEKQIKDTMLWNRYFTLAIALGVGNVARYVKYIPDFSSFENIVNTFYNSTDGYFGLYNVSRELYIEAKLNSFIRKMNKFSSSYMEGMSSGGSGGSSGSGGFSSGGGRFSGGGGRRWR